MRALPVLLVALLASPATAVLATNAVTSAETPTLSGEPPQADLVSTINVCLGDFPEWVDECGDTLRGDLVFIPGKGIAFPAGTLLGDAADGLAFGGNRVCVANQQIAGCSGGDITGVIPGTGLFGGGTMGDVILNVDFGSVQARVGATCVQGSSIRAIISNGDVVCETDDNTLFTAGTGLLLNGTQFSVNTVAVQNRVGASCAAGSSVRAIAQDGTVTCEPDDDTNSGGTVTSIAAGSGLNGGPITTTGTLSIATGGVTSAMIADGAIQQGDLAFTPGDITAVTAGTGLSGGGNSGEAILNVDFGSVQARVGATCVQGSSIRAIISNGDVVCEADDDTLFTAGAGLALNGTQFSVNTASVQSRVTGSCAAGQYVRVIAEDGSVTCGSDANGGGTVTSVTAGAGLTGGTITTSGTFAVDTAAIQERITGTCAAGSSVRAIAQDGTVTCEADDSATYSASSPVSLSGTTFGLSSAGCASGEVWKWSGTAWGCDPDVDTNSGGTVTSVASGFGLQGGPVTASGTVSVNTSQVQQRVTGSCAAGNYVRGIAQDGTVTCQADVDTNSGGTVTSVASGSGLTGGPITGTGTLSIATGGVTSAMIADGAIASADVDATTVQRRIAGSCPSPGNAIRAIAQDGTVTCEPTGTGDVTGVTAGSGLSGGGLGGDVSLSVNTTQIQSRVAGSCAAGQYVRVIAQDGSVTCGSDANGGGTVTSITASAGLTGGTITGSGTIAVDTATIQNRVTGACATGNSIRAIAQDGTVTCEADDSNAYTASSPLSLSGSTFGLSSSGCSAGEVWKWTPPAWACEPDANGGGTVTSVATGAGLTGGPITASGTVSIATEGITSAMIAGGAIGSDDINSAEVQRRIAGACESGQALRVISEDGSVACEVVGSGDLTGVTAGSGLSGGGSTGEVTLSVNTDQIQSRVSGNCIEGEYLRIIAMDGSVTCGVDQNGGGTVTSVETGPGLVGGPIMESGTISIATGGIMGSMVADDQITTFHIQDVSLQIEDFAFDPATQAELGAHQAGSDHDARYYTKAELGDAGAINAPGNPVHWTKLAGAPEGFADGNDDDTLYQPGAGLTLAGTTFEIPTGGVDTDMVLDGTLESADIANGALTAAKIADGAITSAKVADSAVTSVKITDGAVTAADIDATAVQRRIAGSCNAGNAIRAINQDGTVTCEALTGNGDITAVAAGTGLTGGGQSGDITISLTTPTSTSLGGVKATTCATGHVVTAVTTAGDAGCAVDRWWLTGSVPRANKLATVDATGDVGQYASLTVGENALPVIAYYDATNGDLKVAACAALACDAGTTISTLDSTGNVGREASIAIGLDGKPVVAYRDLTNGDLKVAKCGNAACSAGTAITSVDTAGDVGRHVSIAIGTDGFPAIAYEDVTNSDLKVAKCGNAACSAGNTVTTVDSAGIVGGHTSIAIGPDGFPVISYADNTNNDLKVAKCGNAACSAGNTLTAVYVNSAGSSTSIAIGSTGTPVIAYQTGQGPRVTRCGNAACTAGNTFVDPLQGLGDTPGDFSLVLASDGLPFVAYYETAGADLKVLKCSDTGCSAGNTATAVDTTGTVGEHASATLGADELPIVAYYDATNGDLRMAKLANVFGISNWWHR
ncbi:MAG TPA: hypothetical protein VGR28_03265 [Candidatus Thermoplasmatota archaeon]|jgi:hypothetical protein|nr:hypothetical protein [Candidatus Thermoplasmatota archaeon]